MSDEGSPRLEGGPMPGEVRSSPGEAPAAGAPDAARGKIDARPLAFVWGLAVLALGRCLVFPFMYWDDGLYVTRNPLVLHPFAQGIGTLLKTPALGYPAPVTVLSFALDNALFGLEPTVFHAENLALHLANIALVYVLAQVLGLAARDAGRAASLFAVHPLVVEPVCWVTGRKDLLATFLVLIATLLVAREKRAGTGQPSIKTWAIASVVSVVAILTKPTAEPAPGFLAVTARARQPSPPWRGILVRVAPLGVAAVLLAMPGGLVADRPKTGFDALLDAMGGLALQLGHFVWPQRMVTMYSRDPGDPSHLAMGVAVVVALAVAVAVIWKGSRLERWGLGFAACAYVPVTGALGMRWVCDSYMYLPLIGIGVALAAFSTRAPARLAPAVQAAWIGGPIALAAAAFLQTSNWAKPEAVWDAVIARYPDDAVALVELGRTYEAEERFEDAARAFARIDTETPWYEGALVERAHGADLLGNHARAMELLALGVRQGKTGCVRDYWTGLLFAPGPPPPASRDTIARAFELGIAPIEKDVDDPRVFARMAQILHAVDLDDQARRAEADAVKLSSRARSPAAP